MDTIRVDDDIILRWPSLDDLALVFRLVDSNREHLGRWLPFVEITLSPEDERPWVEGHLAARESGANTPPLIMHRDALVGTISAMHLDSLDRAGEIGYWLAEEAQGKGIATRACRALLDYVFNDRDMHRIQIRAATDNSRSRAIPERLGFTYEGVQRQAGYTGERGFHDLAVYSMLAHEWKGQGH